MTPAVASRPNMLPPVSRTAFACSIRVPGRRPSVPRVPGPPPRTSTPATAPAGVSTIVQPVFPRASLQWPTVTPAGNSNFDVMLESMHHST